MNDEYLTSYFNKEVTRIVKLGAKLPRDTAESVVALPLLLQDIQAVDIIADRCLAQRTYTQKAETSGNIYTDTQSFYMFASKVMVEMYLLLKIVTTDEISDVIKSKIATQSSFKNFINAGGSETAITLRGIFGHSLNLLDSCIYTKRNKMIEHWADNPAQSKLFPCFYLLDGVHILSFVNNDTYKDYFKAQSGSIDYQINKLKKLTIDSSADYDQRYAILDYYYPSLTRNERVDLDKITDFSQMVSLPVSRFLIESFRKFLDDILTACERYEKLS